MGESAEARYTAEFVGTYVLVTTIGCNVLTGQAVWGGVSIACSLMVMIYALGKSSGANFNPAVSLALAINNQVLSWKDCGIYICVQLLGALCAAYTYKGMFGKAFDLAPTQGHTMWQAGVAELLYTCMLVFVVLNVAVSQSHGGKNQFYGLAIGFVVVAGAYGAGGISGGCFNPAVAFGIDIADLSSFGNCFKYAAFEFAGAVLAVVLFWVVRPDEKKEMNNGIWRLTEDAGGNKVYSIASKLTSEFLGTFYLILTVGLNVLGGSTAGAFSIAASLMCMIFALGSVSGAHFNPAVTVAILTSGRGKIPPVHAAMYIGAQILGGICAAYTYVLLKGGKTFALKPEVSSLGEAFAAEFAFTFVLAFVVLSVATSEQVLSEYFGFAIGMCVTVGGCAIGKISGGSLNPAVTLAISSHNIQGNLFAGSLYCVAELLAGVAAALVYYATQPSEYAKKPRLLQNDGATA